MRKTVQIRLVAGIAICLLALSAEAQYSGGSGTAEDPYQIATAEDLMLLGESPGDYDKHFILTADIDLDPSLPDGKVFDRAVIAPGANDDEEWFQGTAFTGIFDGNAHTISHLTIEGGGYLGLFGTLGPEAEISNLGLEAIDINGIGDCVGSLVGVNGSSITTCYSTGTVTGEWFVGGLVGFNGGSITMSHSTGTVTGEKSVGGLVGSNKGNITTSFSIGSVSGNSAVGGLVGRNGDDASITSCYSTGSVSGEEYVGGLVGDTQRGYITSCYSTGTVTGDSSVRGLIGWNEGTMFTSCFWDMETSGQATSAGGFGLTTIEMMDPQMLGLNGLLVNDPNWVLDAGRDYPRLAWEGTPGDIIPEPIIDWMEGQGTDQEPYRVDTADQLIFLGRASVLWDKHFILGADIDLDPSLLGRKVFDKAVIAPSGLNTFTGVFDGNNHKISHLTIEGGGFLGLFGQLGSGAAISNIALEAVDVNGTGDYVGGLVGYNDGSITSSYSTGAVSGRSAVGGLIGSIGGWYSEAGILSNSYSYGTVNGDEHVGGLVGVNWGTITSSYSTGSVTGDYTVGGLVGINGGSIAVSVWDMEASGLTVSAGGVGLTTAEMMDPTMLGLNGFANDPNWILDAGRDYPRLAWEGTAGQIILEPIIDWLDGQGTDQEPYRIDTADQLILLSRAGALWDKHFILGADIDLDPNLPGRQVFSQSVIGAFSGVLDGNDHTISHLTIRGGSYRGLFGQLASGATISNLGLEAVDVNGTGSYVGGLVGYNKEGSINNSYSTGTVSGDNYVGGLVGYNNEGSITTCYSTGTVSGDWEVGGLTGSNSASVSKCYSTGLVSGHRYVGGLVGGNEGSIATSYSTGSVSGGRFVGGLVGSNQGGQFRWHEGLWVEWEGSITTSYSTGTVTGEYRVGGLVGSNYEFARDIRITASFWDIQTSGQITSEGGTGLSTGQMQTASTFLDAGWDFVDETTNGTDEIWWIPEGRGYPRLWWEKLYVDDDARYDLWPGNPQISDPLENGRQTHPFDSIQEAIDVAPDGLTILVLPGEYGKIDFKGKAITVAGAEGATIIGGSSYGGRAGSTTTMNQDAVTFHTGEGPDSVLKNFVITEYGMAISLNYGSSPTIRNITIVNNQFGIAAYESANPDISNCIFWNNSDGDLFDCEARYSCLEYPTPGQGNIAVNPLFVDEGNIAGNPLFADPVNGDYHLKSEGWRWSTNSGSWTWDDITSRCIDAGDPDLPLGDEPMSVPRDPNNEYGINRRINMGAYGGTSQASIPPLGWVLPEFDTTAPDPDPAQWAPDGAPREVHEKVDGVLGYWAQMTAAEATDDTGWVEYFFECTTNSGFNSGWQSSRTYSVLMGFLPRSVQEQRFRIKTRDLYDNETEWSEELPAN